MKTVSILVLSGPLKGHKYFVKTDEDLLIGRGAEAVIKIDYDNYCSRKHCYVTWDGDECYLQDCGSKNGTYVNKVLIKQPILLKSRDIISLGKTTMMISI